MFFYSVKRFWRILIKTKLIAIVFDKLGKYNKNNYLREIYEKLIFFPVCSIKLITLFFIKFIIVFIFIAVIRAYGIIT